MLEDIKRIEVRNLETDGSTQIDRLQVLSTEASFCSFLYMSCNQTSGKIYRAQNNSQQDPLSNLFNKVHTCLPCPSLAGCAPSI